MKYEYRCQDHGIVELSHGMRETREGRLCPICKKQVKPIISGGAGILLTGRPPWAYNDIIKRATKSEEGITPFNVHNGTTVTDKREGSKYKGQKRKIDRSMGVFNAQW